MKKNILILIILLSTVQLFGQMGYTYNSQFIELKADSSQLFIQTKENNEAVRELELLSLSKTKSSTPTFVKMARNRFIIYDKNYTPNKEDYVSNIYSANGKGHIIVLPRIVLKLKSKGTIPDIVKEFRGKIIVEQDENTEVILKCLTNNSKDVLTWVNKLSSKKEVIWCEPEMYLNYTTNNPLYPQQYYLKNTGQNGGTVGVDINVEPAWDITNGNSDITVAVLDEGVDRNHEDMGNRVLKGYTIGNPNGYGAPQNAGTIKYTEKGHGMACAGIIGASNNVIGLKGIANNIKILPVNIVPNPVVLNSWGGVLNGGFGTNIEIANAIRWASNRADILSCSWGGNFYSNEIESAINYVRTNGRNGLGCIVVAASGNENDNPYVTDVGFPANIDGVITVGAINNKGNIWNYSQRGSSMDVVAPSGDLELTGDVVTTDRMGTLGYEVGNYTNRFGGTSAACPQVVGVVALMLSVNPNLTESEVRTVLQNTAKDLGASGFDNTYGYGLVDAYVAVKAVAPSISGPTTVCEEATYSIENLPAGASVEWSVEKPNLAKIDNNGRIRFVSGQSGNTDIIANISLANNNIEIRKRIAIGHPEFVIDCIADLGNGQAVFFASPKNNYGFTSSYFNYHWWYSDEYGNNFTTVGNYYNETFVNIQPVIDFPSRGTYIISMIVSGTDCDIPLAKTTYKVLDKNNFFSLYPNPASSVVNLELNESEQAEAQATECRVSRTTEKVLYEIQLWNSTGILKTIKSTQSKVQIPLSGLPKGLYYVLVIKDGKTERQKLVVE